MFVRPTPGLKVQDPMTKRVLPPEGADVPESSFWLRRLAAGDVVVVEANQISDSEESDEVAQ